MARVCPFAAGGKTPLKALVTLSPTDFSFVMKSGPAGGFATGTFAGCFATGAGAAGFATGGMVAGFATGGLDGGLSTGGIVAGGAGVSVRRAGTTTVASGDTAAGLNTV